MKRFLASVATFSLAETFGRHPVIAGVLSLLGVGGGAAIAVNLITPTLLPFVSSNFNPSQSGGATSNGLRPNGGTSGATSLPVAAATHSALYYGELVFDPNLPYTQGQQAAFPGMFTNTNGLPGQPDLFWQKQFAGQSGAYFWLNPGPPIQTGSSGNTIGSNYAVGFFPVTGPASLGCTRPPSGVWQPSTGGFKGVDPGLGCPNTALSMSAAALAANVPGSGAQQATGTAASPAQTATTCTPNSPISGEVTLTVHLAVAHGITPGLTYALGGFPGVFSTTYTALTGTTGSTLIGEAAINGGSCTTPVNFTGEGTALSGTGAAINFPAVTTTNPYGIGNVGITARNNQHACFLLVENGDDSPFPGSQAISFVDENGNALAGSPALVPTPNQSAANFNGWTAASSNILTVTLPLKAYVITSGAWALGAGNLATTGLVTFQVSSNPGFVPGSEFTVSGMLPSSVNGTYIAVAGTSSTQVVGNQLTGPNSIPQAYANPGAITLGSTPQLVAVILPGQTVFGATPSPSYILPYNTGSTTGVGADGTYQLSATQTAALGTSGSPAVISTYSGFYYSETVAGTPVARTSAQIGDMLSIFGASNTSFLPPQKVGWGGAIGNVTTLAGFMPMQTGSAPSTADLASICTKTTDITQYASTKGLKVGSLYRLNDLGIWGDSGDATITGHITNSTGTNATLVVDSTVFGSLGVTPSQPTANLTGVGLPVASPVTIPLTAGASSTYAITPNTTAVLGSIGSPVTFAVGAFKPALPLQSNTLKGYIDTSAGVSTLHVTSLDDGSTHSGFAAFTGTLGTTFTARIDDGGTTPINNAAGNILTLTLPTGLPPINSVVGVGTRVCPPVGSAAFTCANVTALGTGAGLNGTYTIDGSAQNITGQSMFGSGILPGPATTLQATSFTAGTLLSPGMAITDGGASLTGTPLLVSSSGTCTVCVVAGNYYPPINGDVTMQGSLTTLVPGEYIQNAAVTNPVKIVGYGSGAIGLVGNYTLSGPPNAVNTCGGVGCVGSAGSPVVFTGTTITDGGAIAPGPALHIDDRGPSITYPITNWVALTGTLRLTGSYDAPTLGGTPTGIQVLVSNSANGPALTGCTPCNWGALTGTISGGAWSGTLSGIPGGGPYFVSVRAANGVGYATLPNSIKVGLVFALYGQGQADSMQGAQSGSFDSYFSGLWGFFGWVTQYSGNDTYLQGPPISGQFVPAAISNYAGDRFGVAAAAVPSEAVVAFDQELVNTMGVPTSFMSPTHDGVGIGIMTLGNVPQQQTIGSGDNSTQAWCSASKFCGHVDTGGPLVFNAASMTGVWFNGSVSGATLTVTTRYGGAIEPGMALGATGSPIVLRCLTSCTNPLNIDGSTWALSSTAASGATGTLAAPLRADPVGALIPFGGSTTPWPNLNIQSSGTAVYGFAGFGWPLVKAGTFKVTDTDPATGIATTVCQDSQVFAYNNTGGNCTGAGVSGFVNYQTGDYQINFTTAPVSGHALVAAWTSIITPETLGSAQFSRLQAVDFFGDGGCQSGAVSAMFCKAPGGVNGHIFSGYGTDKGYMLSQASPAFIGYQYGGIGYSQMVSNLYSTKFPFLVAGANAAVAFITTGQWRVEGPTLFGNPAQALDGVHDQWTQDVATKSTFSGHVVGSVLTLDGAATGPMWEGEIIGCVTFVAGNGNCPIGPLTGAYITSLASGAWGAIGSTYNLAGSLTGGVTDTGAGKALQNPVYYSGAGPAYYAGTLNDIIVQSGQLTNTIGRNPHTSNGFTGGRRATSRWAAMIYGANNASAPATDPKLSRANDSAAGTPSPAFDYTTTYQASHAATWTGNTVTVTGGLAAHARPFVVGQAFSCTSCASGLVITSLSVPPTESTATGAGEVGQTFTFTAKNAAGAAIGGSGTGTVTGGCSPIGGSGGSNCINVDVAINVSGTFGTAAAIDTCGANNLNGNAPNYVVPTGKCQGNGIGELVRAFRIGTNQMMNGNGASVTAGSVFDDGVDMANGAFNQSAASTCNIVAAKTAQCVKAPAYSSGVLTGVGQWSSGSTYISYGDLTVVSGRLASLLGYVGGQSFPFTGGGTGYSNQSGVAAVCTTVQAGGTAPRFDIWTSGGVIIDVVPSAATTGNVPAGLGVGSTCTLTPATGSGFNGTGSITIPVAPLEGAGGIGTYNTDSNTMGMFLYDNSGFPGNPLNQFFTNGTGGYFEPGLPVRPFGEFQGAAVSG